MSTTTSAYTVQVLRSGSWTTINPDYISQVTGAAEFTGDRSNGLALGDDTSASFEVRGLGSQLKTITPWERLPIRVSYVVGPYQGQAAYGQIVGRSWDGFEMTWQCEGIAAMVRQRKGAMYSPMIQRRPAFTRTTSTSVEDPSEPAYAGGLGNWMLWMAGGRPWEQDFTYPAAAFYYRVPQHAPIAVDYAWVAAETDPWAELLKLCRAGGGQLFQAPDGVLEFRPALGFASAVDSGIVLDSGSYATISQDESLDQVMDQVSCQFTPRYEQAMQQVVEDTTLRVVQPGETLPPIDLVPSWPLTSLAMTSATTLDSAAFNAQYLDGQTVSFTAAAFLHSVEFAAQRIRITITNPSTLPFVINRITLRGTPVVAGEEQSVTVGSGDTQKALERNEYIQRHSHALRLAQMTLAFNSSARPTRTVSGVVYDPRLQVGTVLTLNEPDLDISNEPHLVIGVDDRDTGTELELRLISVAGLPTLDQFYRCNVPYTTTKQLAY